MRERQAHCYYLWVYYATKLCTQLPLDIFVPVLFSSIVYWIVGLNPDPVAFVVFLMLTVLISLSAVGIGLAVGACAPNIDAANAMAPVIMVLMILFGGFYINCWWHILSLSLFVVDFLSAITWSVGIFKILPENL